MFLAPCRGHPTSCRLLSSWWWQRMRRVGRTWGGNDTEVGETYRVWKKVVGHCGGLNERWQCLRGTGASAVTWPDKSTVGGGMEDASLVTNIVWWRHTVEKRWSEGVAGLSRRGYHSWGGGRCTWGEDNIRPGRGSSLTVKTITHTRWCFLRNVCWINKGQWIC